MALWKSIAKIGLVVGGYALFGPLGGIAGAYAGSQLWPVDYETEMPTVHDMPIQSSAIGIPITIVLGTKKLAGNIIYLGEFQSYQVKHSSGGGKGGPEEQVSYETRYRRSFLISICEGPATIIRAWKNKEEISLADFTSYNGDNNSGISTILGKDYAEYSNLCLAYFEDYELGNSQAIPNFSFEVRAGAIQSFTHNICLAHLISSGYALFYRTQITDNGDGTFSEDISELQGTNDAYTCSQSRSPGNIYFQYESKIAKYNQDLQLITDWQTSGYLDFGEGNVRDFDSDADEYLVIAIDASGEGVYLRNPDGSAIWNILPPNGSPREVCFTSDGDILVGVYASTGGTIAYKLSRTDGSVLASYGTNAVASWWCRGIDEAKNGDVVVVGGPAGTTGHSITRWSSTGGTFAQAKWSYIFAFKYIISVSGYFQDVVCHSNGNIYACGYQTTTPGNSTIWAFNSAGVLINKFDTDANDELLYMTQIVEWREGVIVIGNAGMDELGARKHFYVFGKKLNYKRGLYWEEHNPDDYPKITIFSVAYQYPLVAADMNFAEMIRNLLINEKCGNYEDGDLITEDFNSIITYCETNNLKGSLAITQQKPLPDWIAYICSHFQGYFYEIGGKIGLNCYRSQASVLSISQDDLTRDSDSDEPPVHVTKRPYSSTYNRLEAAWTDRSHNYKTAVVPAFDRVDQRESGQIRTKILDLKMICNKELAAKMAWRIFIDQIYRFSQYTFKLGYKSMLLEVGDVIDVTDGHLITAKKMRVMSVDEEKDGRRSLISAVEDIADFYPEIEYAVQESKSEEDPDITLEDGTIAFRENYLDNRLFLSITPGGVQCNGFYIYRSYDNESYDLIGRCSIAGVTGGQANSTGTIQSNLPSYPAIVHRKDEAFNVSIGNLTDLDTAIADNDFFNNRKIARIGTEIIGYKTCVESVTTAGIWRVSNLIRGLFGTEAVAHIPGESFNTLDVNFPYTLRDTDIGKTLYFKVISFYADKQQLLSEVSAQSHVVSGKYMKPLPISLLRINGREGLLTYKTGDVTLDWYFCSKTSGFGRGGYGNALWGAYMKDPLLERLKVELEEEDGTPIIGANYLLTDYGEPVQLEILEADRDGKNPVNVKLTPGSHLWSDETRNILIERT